MPMVVSGVAELVTAFGAATAEVKAALRPGVAEATHLIADAAESNASFSSYIPDAISESVSFSASGGGGIIKVAERGKPHGGEARVLEGNGISPTAFLHPYFGRGAFPGMTHPFLGPAVIEKGDEAVAVIESTVMTALNALF